jgi:hypothetical protein
MTRFNPRRFTDPDWLGTIAPNLLAALLKPWRDYLAQRGFALPDPPTERIDCESLTAALMTPDAHAPAEMLDALYYVHETCSEDDVEALCATARGRGIVMLTADSANAADIVVQIWLADRDLVMDRHAEVIAQRQRNLEFFRARSVMPWPDVEQSSRAEIELACDDWFAAHRRGRGCKLLIFPGDRSVSLLVRHGRGMKRELSHTDDGSSEPQIYRPQQHDVVVYDCAMGEIGIHATTKGERHLYLRVLGEVLFGDAAHFSPMPKFTLRPLVEDGGAALACCDAEGIDEVRLVEYRQYRGAQFRETETRRATDVFAALAARGLSGLLGPEPSSATFIIKFTDSPKERRVTIRLPSTARYERTDDAQLVERWLALRGFLTMRSEDGDHGRVAVAKVLDGAGLAAGMGD